MRQKTNETETQYALVLGRHFGILKKEGNELSPYYDPKRMKIAKLNYLDNKPIYAEAITGGCSYFSIFEQMFCEKYPKNLLDTDKQISYHQCLPARTLLHFVESALLSVVVIDERFQEQFSKLSETDSGLIRTGEQLVFAGYLDDKSLYTQSQPKNLEDFGVVNVRVEKQHCTAKLKRTISCPDFPEFWTTTEEFYGDILIIHQGILDKWFDVQENKGEKKETLKKLIQCLKQRFQHVIITSGRGRPEDVPDGVRFLPVSAFESGTNGHYEKYPLIQQVLAIVETEK